MRQALAPLSLAALLAAAAIGQDTTSRLERFDLFNACRPMRLLIEQLGDDEAAIGLAEADLQAAAESRLRAARLYTEDGAKANFAFLYVNAIVVGRAVNVFVHYKKVVIDAFGEDGSATTWSIGSAGTHGGNASYVVSGLSQHLDEFLAAYLRVNEEACGSAPGR